MATLTAWRFSSTEGADDAILRLKRLDEQDQIDVEDAAVIRWPHYASAPTPDTHVTRQGGAFSTIAKKIAHGNIAGSTLDSVMGDMTPGTSVLVLLSENATVGAVAKAFEGQSMELIRSDLSVQQEDQVRRVFGNGNGDTPPQGQPGEPG
jgi:uncharacterized membrane protein